jgi:hypothetical protein
MKGSEKLKKNIAVIFSLIMFDAMVEVLSCLFTGQAINELFTVRI